MPANIITTEDLLDFKVALIDEIKALLNQNSPTPAKVYMKSAEVMEMLEISPSTLQNLRRNGTIPYTKIGGLIYYNKEDILKVIEDNTVYHED